MSIVSVITGARIEIIDPGPSTTVQDGGRLGSVHYGVSPSGAVDRRALETANARLGNDPHVPVLETLLGGISFRVTGDRWCAVAGARATVRIDGELAADPERFLAPGGSRVDIGEASRGLYTVLAVAGGVEAARTLGSASTDTLSGIGPARLAPGDAFDLGEPGALPETVLPDVALPAARAEIAFRWGPRDARFDAADRELLLRTEWSVSNDTNRVGARLDGARLRGGDGTLPSEGIMTGSIQIPPSGQPIVFLADRPVTGGYPVIGVVDEHDLGRFAQVRPGERVRFRPLS